MGSPTESPEWSVGDFAISDGSPVELISEDRPGCFGVRFVQNRRVEVDEYGYQSGGSCYCKPDSELHPVATTKDTLFVLAAKTARELYQVRRKECVLDERLDAINAVRKLVSNG